PLTIQDVLTHAPQWCAAGAAIPTGNLPLSVCQKPLQVSLDMALDELTKSYGDDMNAWRWGTAHKATFNHAVFSHLPPMLARLFDRAVPADGGNDTVDAGVSRINDPDHPYADVHGPSFRAIYDLADLDRSVFIAAPGQSGQVNSAHYDDLLPLWRNFTWLRLSDSAEIGSKLTLVPADPGQQEE
ncbi:MAG TPA: penicillin acylase family protein, partial [Stellaceae bacterium]|nr:penicillin acylase family protein [Stellaceae bacterium]